VPLFAPGIAHLLCKTKRMYCKKGKKKPEIIYFGLNSILGDGGDKVCQFNTAWNQR